MFYHRYASVNDKDIIKGDLVIIKTIATANIANTPGICWIGELSRTKKSPDNYRGI